MSNLTAVSLFAGVGGFDLAMQRNGIEVVAAVEIDKKCRDVLSQKFPKTKLFDDVKEVTGEQLKSAGFIPERGIITGGFPCQDLSVAGLRKGLAGERSGLFHQIIRLVDELEPQFVILENVPGLLSSQSGRDMGIVITALVERGYGVCWRVLDSQNFGVPQRRRRVFIVASLGNHRQPVQILFESESSEWDIETLGKKRKRTASTTETSTRTFVKSRRAKTIDDDETWVEVEPVLFQGNRVGDPRFYEDGVSPTVMSRWGTGGNNVPITYTKQSFGEYQELNVASTMSRRDYKDSTDLVIEQSKAYNMRSDAIANNMTVYETEQTGSVTSLQPSPLTHRSQTLIAQTESVVEESNSDILMRNREGKPGDGKGPLLSNDMSLTIATSNDQTLFTKGTVRRLTPTECERLQGFPDGWTDGQADSNRYKQIGNAVTVNVVEWIMKRLVNSVE